MTVTLVLLFILFVILTILLVLFIFFLFFDSLYEKAPFISTRKSIIPNILSELEIKQDSVLFDLGCGNGYILRAAKKKHNSITAIGIDIGVMPIIIAKILSVFYSIQYKRGDMLTLNVSGATHIYVYTGTILMELLEKKLFNECKKGTRIVSLDFPFPNIKPVKNIKLPKSKLLGVERNLFVYVV